MSQYRFHLMLQQEPDYITEGAALMTHIEEAVNTQLASIPVGGDVDVLHGYDHALGYFVTILSEDEHGNEYAHVDVSSKFNGWDNMHQYVFLFAIKAPRPPDWSETLVNMPY